MTSNNLVRSTAESLVPRDLIPTLESHRAMLAEWARREYLHIGERDRVLLPAQIEQIERELSALDTGCDQRRALTVTTKLAMSYPQSAGDDPSAFKMYIAAMSDAVAGYPEAIGSAAATAVLRSCRFRPSVAEFIAEAEKIKSELAGSIPSALGKMKHEIERRADKQQEADRRKAERERLGAEVDDAVVKGVGHAGVRPGDVVHADRLFSVRQMAELIRAGRGGEISAARPLMAASLLSRIHIAACDRRATYAEAMSVAYALADEDLIAATIIVNVAEERPSDPTIGTVDRRQDPRHRSFPWSKLREIASASLRVFESDDVIDYRTKKDAA